MQDNFGELDVRRIFASGGDPFGAIMQALTELPPGAGLRLTAPFKPVPLFAVMADKGYGYEARPLEDDAWEVLFRPEGEVPPTTGEANDSSGWPAPSVIQDNRALDQPEPSGFWLQCKSLTKARYWKRCSHANLCSCFRNLLLADMTGAANLPAATPQLVA